MDGNGLLIGEVAARSGVSRKALRLYEARGILTAPRRGPSGYRYYDSDVLRLLTFVGQARRLGLTLSEIKHIVALHPLRVRAVRPYPRAARAEGR